MNYVLMITYTQKRFEKTVYTINLDSVHELCRPSFELKSTYMEVTIAIAVNKCLNTKL